MLKIFIQFLTISTLVFSGSSGGATFQISDLADKAAELANKIDQSNISWVVSSGVVVFDFVGPDGSVTLLGRGLADNFTSELSKIGGRFYVVDRAYLAQAMVKSRLAPAAIENSDLQYSMAKTVSARAFVVGMISRRGNELTLELKCFRVEDRALIDEIAVTMLVTTEIERLLQSNVDPDALIETQNLKTSGVSAPICDNCRGQLATKSNVAAKYHLTVILLAVIGEDGKARDLQILKGSSEGVGVKAIEQVQTWKFVPAKDAEGKSIAVRIPLEVSFDLY